MARELILMANVDGLGLEGAIVKVADGYARNYLIPGKLAVPLNNAALKRLEKNRQEREAYQKAELDKAQALAATIEKLECTIAVKVGENEKMFGSVTAQDIVAALKAQGFELERQRIRLDQPIRELGVYNIKVALHLNLEASFKVWVVGE